MFMDGQAKNFLPAGKIKVNVDSLFSDLADLLFSFWFNVFIVQYSAAKAGQHTTSLGLVLG